MALPFFDRFWAPFRTGFILLAMMVPVLLEAQTPAQYTPPGSTSTAPSDQPDHAEPDVTLTGCLLLGPYGDFTLSRTVVTGTVLHQVAWKLEGGKELLGHVLEKVEVTGPMLPMPPETPLPATNHPASGNDAAIYRLQVKTIKRLSGSCSQV